MLKVKHTSRICKLTIASLLADVSFPTGAFCFDELLAFTGGGVTRPRREGSIANQPLALPSSPVQSYKFITPNYEDGISKFF